MPKSWTDGAPAPVALQDHAHLKDPLSYKIKRRLLGGALNRHTLSHQRLDKKYALGILSSDCISSSAYGSEQILIALIPAALLEEQANSHPPFRLRQLTRCGAIHWSAWVHG